MRSTLKFAVPLAVAALALGACGTKGGETPAPGGTGGAAQAACDLKIGMFGALTGPNANLGIYIQNGVNLALDDYNKANPDCKVALENYDSQGLPDQARLWPRRPSTTRRSSASSAPPSPVSPRPPTRRSTRQAS